MKWTVIGVLLVVMVLYLTIGGLIFSALESHEEVRVRSQLINKTMEFIDNHACVGNEEVKDLILEVVRAYDSGVIGGEINASTESINWDLASSVFFAGTVITTIGYGNLSPSTSGGRTFCIFYAMFGIPLLLMLLAGIGEKLHSAAQKIEELKICKDSPRKGKYLKILIIVTGGYILFVMIPSFAFSSVEDWTIGESVYFSMITLTTIGFGDYVAGTGSSYKYRRLYRISLFAWMIVGLSWLSLVIGSIQDFARCIFDKTDAVALSGDGDKSEAKSEEDEQFADNEKITLKEAGANKNNSTLVNSISENKDCDDKV